MTETHHCTIGIRSPTRGGPADDCKLLLILIKWWALQDSNL